MLRRLLICALLLAPATVAAAEPMKLGAGDIKDTFTGSRVELDTPLGTTIPIKFTGDGLMSGSAGSLASVLGAANDRGRWWVKGDRLCYKWFRWFDAEEQCLTIHLKDERVYWRRDDGKKGTATIVERPAEVADLGQTPLALEKKTVIRTASLAPALALQPPQVKVPVLKSPPRLAVRPKTAAEELGLPEEAPADRGLFFVGLGLARALQTPFSVTHAEAASVTKVPAKHAASKVPTPVKKHVALAAIQKPAPQSSAPAAALSPDLAAARPTAIPASFSVYGVAADDVLNMRSGPSEEYAVIGAIPPHASSVRMVGRCIGLWCEIQFRDQRGWVNRYYLFQN